MSLLRRKIMLAEALKGDELELNYLTIVPEEAYTMLEFKTWGYLRDDGSWVYAELLGSLDGGANWYSIPNDGTITIQQGDKLLLKANYYNFINENPSILDSDYTYANIFGRAGKFSVEGTPLSLAHGDDFKTRRELITLIFSYLFAINDNLIRINNPESFLPSTELAAACYAGMFAGCSILENAPALPATSLVLSCYAMMFRQCTSLTKAPILPATTLVMGCYDQMFYDCSNLNYIKAMFTTTPSDDYTYKWVINVSSTGTFVMSKDADWYVIGNLGIPAGWTVVNDGEESGGQFYVNFEGSFESKLFTFTIDSPKNWNECIGLKDDTGVFEIIYDIVRPEVYRFIITDNFASCYIIEMDEDGNLLTPEDFIKIGTTYMAYEY